MKVEIKLFAAAKQFAGGESVQVELPTDARVSDLRRTLTDRFPDARLIWRHALFAIDMEYVDDSAPLRQSADIACIPPVSGG